MNNFSRQDKVMIKLFSFPSLAITYNSLDDGFDLHVCSLIIRRGSIALQADSSIHLHLYVCMCVCML